MLFTILPTPFFGANCIVIVPDRGDKALVVDPSHGVLDEIRSILDATGRTVGAILCTHGHPDHVWDAAAASRLSSSVRSNEVAAPVWLPGPDMERMDDPLGWVPTAPPGMVLTWEKPTTLRQIPSETFQAVEGLQVMMVPAPGHTAGSALFLGQSPLIVHSQGEQILRCTEPTSWALTGDVIFAGSVGRTDLRGGDETQMRHTLRTLTNSIHPQTVLFPGHGPITSMQREIETNPYVIRARAVG